MRYKGVRLRAGSGASAGPTTQRRHHAHRDRPPRREGHGSLARLAEARRGLRPPRCHQHPDFVNPQNPTQVAVLMDVADMDAVMAVDADRAAAEAMEYDGVLPELWCSSSRRSSLSQGPSRSLGIDRAPRAEAHAPRRGQPRDATGRGLPSLRSPEGSDLLHHSVQMPAAGDTLQLVLAAVLVVEARPGVQVLHRARDQYLAGPATPRRAPRCAPRCPRPIVAVRPPPCAARPGP